MKKTIEPSRCVCRRKPSIEETGWVQVVCMGNTVTGRGCWVGPQHIKRQDAVRAWNRVMDAARGAKEGNGG